MSEKMGELIFFGSILLLGVGLTLAIHLYRKKNERRDKAQREFIRNRGSVVKGKRFHIDGPHWEFYRDLVHLINELGGVVLVEPDAEAMIVSLSHYSPEFRTEYHYILEAKFGSRILDARDVGSFVSKAVEALEYSCQLLELDRDLDSNERVAKDIR